MFKLIKRFIERKHYLKCRVCGKYLDMRDLSQVFAHEDHKPHRELNIKGKRLTTADKAERLGK